MGVGVAAVGSVLSSSAGILRKLHLHTAAALLQAIGELVAAGLADSTLAGELAAAIWLLSRTTLQATMALLCLLHMVVNNSNHCSRPQQ